MPMVKWRVEPTAVCKIGSTNAPTKAGPALSSAEVTNYIFANIIRQLSCLCKTSEEMFDELRVMASTTIDRTSSLTKRVTSLKKMASALNPTVEEISLDDIGAYKPFKSNATKDPSFSLQRPKAVIDVYNSSQSVPAFSKLNQFRDDGKDCVKMYTNPEFFFELWCNQIKKEVNEKKPKRKKRQAQAQAAVTVKAPINVRQVELINKVQRENEAPPIKPKPSEYSKPPVQMQSRQNSISPSSDEMRGSPPSDIQRKPSIQSASGRPPAAAATGAPTLRPKNTANTSSNRPSIPPPPPPPPLETSPLEPGSLGRGRVRKSDLPPPPPSPRAANGETQLGGENETDRMPPPPPPVVRAVSKSSNRGTLYAVGDFNRETAFFPPPPPTPTMPQPPPSVTSSSATAPPPPPPPPLPSLVAVPPPASGSILPTPDSAFQLRSVGPITQKRESRGDLLLSIRHGITLRKVEETKTANEVKQPTGGLFDVQTILEMRRKAMEDDSDEEEEESGWEE